MLLRLRVAILQDSARAAVHVMLDFPSVYALYEC